jgi:glycine/D-amino acid oxidase-like deaminating enzyme
MRNVPMFYVVQRGQLGTFQSQMTVPLRIATKDERARICAMLPGVTLKSGEEFVTHSQQGVIIDARMLTQSLLGSERQQGKTTVETECHVDDIQKLGDKYLVSAKRREWRAANVALAVGAWDLPGSLSSCLYPAAELRCKRVAALHTRLPVDLGDPLVYFIDDDLFVLPHAKGQALVSFRRNAWDVKPDLLDGHADEDDVREGLRALAARHPQAARNCSGGRAFCDLYAPNRLPLIRTSPTLPGLVAVQGGSGSGVRLAPGLALRALAALRAR